MALAIELESQPAIKARRRPELDRRRRTAAGNRRAGRRLDVLERARDLLEPLVSPTLTTRPIERPSPSACTASRASSTKPAASRNRWPPTKQARIIREKLADAEPKHHSISTRPRGQLPRHRRDPSSQRPGGRIPCVVRASRAISQKLAEANPTETPFQSDLAQSYNDIGFVHQETGHLARALTSLEQARAILQRLADTNPAVTQFEADLAQTYQVIGSIQGQTGDSAAALASLERRGRSCKSSRRPIPWSLSSRPGWR